MRPLGIPEQDEFDGTGIPEQELPENQDPDVAFVVDGLTGEKTPFGEQPTSHPRVQSSSAEADIMGGAPESAKEDSKSDDNDQADESSEAKAFRETPVEPRPVAPADEERPKSGPGSRGPYKKKLP